LVTLLEEVLLLPRPGSGTRRAVEEQLAREQVTPRRVLEYGNTNAVMKAVGAGLGVALVSSRAAEHESAAGEVSVVRVRGSAKVHRHFSAVWRRGRFLTRAASAFIEFLGRRRWSRAG
jgi:DNA-binding transcriptional LysR family regulator